MIRQFVTLFGSIRPVNRPRGSGGRWTSEARPQVENREIRVNGARENGADGIRATWMGRPARVRLLGRRRIKRCDMDKQSAAESRGVGTPSQKLGNPSDLELLQKTFDRMK
jgi:hypothetical protein